MSNANMAAVVCHTIEIVVIILLTEEGLKYVVYWGSGMGWIWRDAAKAMYATSRIRKTPHRIK
jgi:hypothetical protein